MRIRFGECVLDRDLHELTRAGRPVALSPKAFRLLEVLAERRPNVVTKAELRARVWPELTAGGTTLARLVNEVRSALGNTGRPAGVIRTVPRVGYAFGAPSVEEGPVAALPLRCALQWGAQQVPLADGEHVIGRTAEARISIPSPKVSRRHARIVVNGESATVEDLGSKNGTFVGGRRIGGPTALQPGDQIQVGPALLVFQCTGPEQTTLTGR